MDLKTVDKLYGILVVSGMILVLLGVLVFDNLTLAFIGVIPTCIAILFVAPKARCPHCGGHLKMKFGVPRTCPHCGKKLL